MYTFNTNKSYFGFKRGANSTKYPPVETLELFSISLSESQLLVANKSRVSSITVTVCSVDGLTMSGMFVDGPVTSGPAVDGVVTK